MKTRPTILIAAILVLWLLFVAASPRLPQAVLPKPSATKPGLGFSPDDPALVAKVAQLSTKSQALQQQGLDAAKRRFERRDRLQIAADVCTFGALVLSLGVALLGAWQGVAVSREPTADELALVGQRSLVARRWILVITTCAAAATGLSDRLHTKALEDDVRAHKVTGEVGKQMRAWSSATRIDECERANDELALALLDQ